MSRRARKNLNIAVVGAGGRMGRAIVKLSKQAGLSVAVKINHAHGWPPDGRGIDGVIEFSSPEGLNQALEWCVRYRKPLVAGTTGLSAADHARIQTASRRIPVLYSANMSPGVAVMRAMLAPLAAIADWTFVMEEVHHARKRDKPSGTAKMLAARLKECAGTKNIRIRSVRRGQVPGIHQIEARGPDETLLIRHTALDRRVFAHGAVRAARWLFDKNKPGLYDLSDLYAVE